MAVDGRLQEDGIIIIRYCGYYSDIILVDKCRGECTLTEVNWIDYDVMPIDLF